MRVIEKRYTYLCDAGGDIQCPEEFTLSSNDAPNGFVADTRMHDMGWYINNGIHLCPQHIDETVGRLPKPKENK